MRPGAPPESARASGRRTPHEPPAPGPLAPASPPGDARSQSGDSGLGLMGGGEAGSEAELSLGRRTGTDTAAAAGPQAAGVPGATSGPGRGPGARGGGHAGGSAAACGARAAAGAGAALGGERGSASDAGG